MIIVTLEQEGLWECVHVFEYYMLWFECIFHTLPTVSVLRWTMANRPSVEKYTTGEAET